MLFRPVGNRKGGIHFVIMLQEYYKIKKVTKFNFSDNTDKVEIPKFE